MSPHERFKYHAVKARLRGGEITGASLASFYQTATGNVVALSRTEQELLEARLHISSSFPMTQTAFETFTNRPHLEDLYKSLRIGEHLHFDGLVEFLANKLNLKLTSEQVRELLAYAGVEQDAVLGLSDLIKLVNA